MRIPVLTLLVVTPAVTSLVVTLLPIDMRTARRILLAVNLILFAISASLFIGTLGPWSQLTEDALWIPQLGVYYALSIDGLSGALLVALFLAMGLSAAAAELVQENQGKWSSALQGIMTTGMAGVLLARDLLLFFLFWETMVVALFVLVLAYGGEGRQRAAIQFLVYTAAGSLLMLAAIAGVYVLNSGLYARPLCFEALPNALRSGAVGPWIAVGFLAAFAVKMPLVPLHAWLPDLYRQTPTYALVVAAFMAKLGGYGFLRLIESTYPSAIEWLALPLGIVALAGFLYASLVALGQQRFIDVLIYASIAHMNLFLLGAVAFTKTGFDGAALQLLNQGVLAALTFYMATWLGQRVEDMGGVGRLAWGRIYLLVAILASLGLPGLNGFASELLIIVGTIERWPVLGILVLLGTVLGACYFILTYRRLAHGDLGRVPEELPAFHRTALAIPLILCLLLGLAPSLILQFISAPADLSGMLDLHRLIAMGGMP